MDIGRAFSYIFEDDEWAGKLVISAVIGFFAIITTPLLIGLIGWAALLGYLVDLVRNLRDRHPTPLPRWDNYGDKIRSGGNVLTAMIIYNLPNLLFSCCAGITSSFWENDFVSPILGIGLGCCVVPLVILFNLIAWPTFWLGVARYAQERNIGVFFQFGDLFGALRRNFGLTFQWIFLALIANLVFGFLAAIPCVGWAGAPALAIPVHAYLLAQFVERLEGSGKLKSKPKRGY